MDTQATGRTHENMSLTGWSVVVQLRAPNDKNGNPRRVWLFMTTNGVERVADEGYAGRPWGEPADLSVRVPVGEYREWIAYGRAHGILGGDY